MDKLMRAFNKARKKERQEYMAVYISKKIFNRIEKYAKPTGILGARQIQIILRDWVLKQESK